MCRNWFHKLALLLSPILGACPTGDDADTGANLSVTSDGSGPGGAPDTTTNADTTTTADATTAADDADTTTSADDTDTADSTGTADSADTATTGETGEAMGGEQLYLTICASCHGMSGEGTELGYEVQHPVRDYSTWVVRNGRPGEEFEDSEMAAFDTNLVSDAELDEIWDYLDSFPQTATGEALYLDYCRNCHGSDAGGGVVDKNISNKGYGSILDTVRDGKHLGEFDSRDKYMPAFDESWLTDDEVHLIADYIASL